MILVIDGTNWAHSLGFGFGTAIESRDQFARRIDLLRRKWHFASVYAAFDAGRSWRHDLYPEYKAHRPAKPEHVRLAVDACREWSVTNNVILESDGFEADDMLASMCHAHADTKIVLAGADKDIIQCLESGRVTALRKINIRDGTIHARWLTADQVPDEFGVKAQQWIDYQCLVGDASDNIPGVTGIGPKTAAALLAKRGTLEAVLDNPWVAGLGGKVRDRLFAFTKMAPLVKQLVTLRRDAPLPIDARP